MDAATTLVIRDALVMLLSLGATFAVAKSFNRKPGSR